jgi:hypothetical protein
MIHWQAYVKMIAEAFEQGIEAPKPSSDLGKHYRSRKSRRKRGNKQELSVAQIV